MMEKDVDPWNWTVEDVVDELCHSRKLWAVGRPNAKLPDPVEFESVLRGNEVDGCTLLCDVSPEELKGDFEVKSLGQRSAIMWAIQQLRHRSLKWRENSHQNALLQPHMLISGAQTPTSNGYSHALASGNYSPALQRIRDTPVPPDGTNGNVGQRSGESLLQIADTETNGNQSLPQNDHSIPTQGENRSLEQIAGHRRQGEKLVEDGAGKKKRRLVLGEPIATSTLNTAFLLQDQGLRPERLLLPSRSTLSDMKSRARSYLGPVKLTQDSIFFGSGKFGETVNSEWDVRPAKEDNKTVTGFELVLHRDREIPGRQKFVYEQLRAFFRRQGISDRVHFAGRQVEVVYPYQPVADMAESSRSVILVDTTENGIKVTKERASNFGSGDRTDFENGSNPSNHDWDFLDHWRRDKWLDKLGPYEELPTYGESETSSEWDRCLESIEAEEEQERESEQPPKQLTKDKVLEVIDEEINCYIAEWTTRKLPLRENKAWTTWRKAKQAQERKDMASNARALVDQYSMRLEKLKLAILVEEGWYQKKKIRDLCKSLEETVHQREEERFKSSVWLRTEAPLRPALEFRTRKKVRQLLDNNQEGITLSSDSEILDEPSSEDDFVDIDDIGQLDMTNDIVSPRGVKRREILPEDNEFEADAAAGLTPSGSDTPGIAHMENHTPKADSSVESPLHVKSEPPDTTQAISKRLGAGQSVNNVIDLTGDDDDDSSEDTLVQTPTKRVLSPRVLPKQQNDFGPDPLIDSAQHILGWDWKVLLEKDDRKRLVIKLLRTLPLQPYSRLRNYVSKDSRQDLNGHIFSLADCLSNGDVSVPELGSEQNENAGVLFRLYYCWLDCSRDLFMHGTVNGQWVFAHKIEATAGKKVFSKIESDHKDVRTFNKFVRGILVQHEKPIALETIDDESLEDEEIEEDEANETPSQATPHKKRKRDIQESQVGKNKRERALKARDEFKDRSRQFLLQTQSSGLGDLSAEEVIVNTGKKDDESPIYVNHNTARQMKPHQIEGIRFMWQEIVVSSKDVEEEDMQGCLLAHTMGLGKTMQAITLLAIIADASTSPDASITSQIPERLRNSRTLILCPASLILNWIDEFDKWVPRTHRIIAALGEIRSIRSDEMKKKEERLSNIKKWYRSGGILLISYDFLRAWVENEPTKKSSPPLTPEEHIKVEKWLLRGPNIIIADEAHHLKNIKSAIAQTAAKFESKSRVALTGSPLNNNLEEYYAMINWVAPDYLGSIVEFRAKYVEPIVEGSWKESTPYERSRSRTKLKFLERMLDPKVHRKEVTVLKRELRPKIEFSVKLPLTGMQNEAYVAFVDSLQGHNGEIVNQARLWAWMHILTLLCNHPHLFWEKLKEKVAADSAKTGDGSESPKKKAGTTSADPADLLIPEEDGGVSPNQDKQEQDDIGAFPTEVVSDVMQQLTQIFEPLKDKPYESEHSYKVKLLLALLRQCQVVGDRVLLFSHSIPTLDFLGSILEKKSIKFMRLDGKTKMSERNAMMKEFNNGNIDVFLISTKAGGLGFNLPGANRVILFDFGFNPTHEEQAIGRAYRLGQEKPVFVYRFYIGGTFEEELLNSAIFKIQLAMKAVDKRNVKNQAEKAKQWLSLPETVRQDDVAEHKGKDSVLDGIIESSAESPFIRSIKTTETLQQESDEVLTAEEVKAVENDLAIEKLRRDDPQAYLARTREQQRNELGSSFAPPAGSTQPRLAPPLSFPPSFPSAPLEEFMANGRRLGEYLRARDGMPPTSSKPLEFKMIGSTPRSLYAGASPPSTAPVSRPSGNQGVRLPPSTFTHPANGASVASGQQPKASAEAPVSTLTSNVRSTRTEPQPVGTSEVQNNSLPRSSGFGFMANLRNELESKNPRLFSRPDKPKQ